MSSFRVLVCSADAAIGEYLRAHLVAARFEVEEVAPGFLFLQAVCRSLAEVAVIDRADERREFTLMAIDIIKQVSPMTRIVVCSGESTPEDGRFVEKGIFYYLAAPPYPRLIEVVEAAVRNGKGATNGGA